MRRISQRKRQENCNSQNKSLRIATTCHLNLMGVLLLLFLVSSCVTKNKKQDVSGQDTDRLIYEKVDNLMAQMTFEEKINQHRNDIRDRLVVNQPKTKPAEADAALVYKIVLN